MSASTAALAAACTGRAGRTPVRADARDRDVAIVGMAVLLPGAPDLDAYWRNLVAGVDAITPVPDHRWDAAYYPDRVYCRRGGFVDDHAAVDVTRFGVMPGSAPGTDPDQLIALHVAAHALADAGGAEWLPERRERVGVVLGRGGYLTPAQARLDQLVRTAYQLSRTLGELLPEVPEKDLVRVREAFAAQLGPERPEAAIGLVPNLVASRIANRLDLRGPAYTTDAACASSLIAVDQAIGELLAGRCDVMLAGGVHHCHDITLWSVFSQLKALSPSERSRPFHRGADGILMGEGTGVVVLRRLADAERDGDRIYAVIRGTGVAADGRVAGLVSPDPGGQARAVRQAWAAAGVDPAAPGSVGLLEAHGTGTPAGDAAELATLADVFGPPGADRDAVLGSVKSMIGHTMPAAGAAGLVKAALAVHHATLLPTLHCDEPHEALARTRFRPLAAARPWEAEVRRAGVSAFGFGGINAHVVLEQAPCPGAPVAAVPPGSADPRGSATSPAPAGPAGSAGSTAPTGFPASAGAVAAAPSSQPRVSAAAANRVVNRAAPTAVAVVGEPEPVLRLTARTPAELAARLDADDAALRALAAAGTTAGTIADAGPGGGPVRLGVVAPDARRLALARRAAAKGQAWRGRGDVWYTPAPLLDEAAGGRLAFVFPGLEAEFEPRVEEVAEHFGLTVPGAGASIGGGAVVGDVGRHGVGVLRVGRVLDAALRKLGVVPDAVAGHSIGEWSAMAAGGLYDAGTADKLLRDFDPDSLRVPGVVFAAIGAPADRVRAALAEAAEAEGGGRGDVVLSHDNSPSQSMICGPEEAVEHIVRSFRARRVIAQVLPFRSGFHTPMLAPYLGPLTEGAHAMRVHRPAVPVWSGTTAAPFPEDAEAVRELFVRHLLEPVRFRPLIESMHAAGFRAFVQVGTGRLGSLIADTLRGRDVLTVPADSPRRGGLAQLRRVTTALWTEGRPPAAEPAGRAPTGAPGRSAKAPLTGHAPVRLNLGGALVSLPEPVRDELRSALRPVVPVRPGHAAAGATGGATAPPTGAGPAVGWDAAAGNRLAALAGRHPAAAELHAALRETADTAAALLAGDRPPAPRRPAAFVADPSPPPSRRAAPPARASRSVESSLRVSVQDMPYLLDHCFIPQRPGWPDLADRRPVVPATTIVQHMVDAALRAAPVPGAVAVAVHDVRLEQWLAAEPAADVRVTAVPEGADRVAVTFGPYARAVVELASGYPGRKPAPWRAEAVEEPCALTAPELYEDRWMFHGPAFQGVTDLTAIGDAHIRGTIRTPAAPGALLDNVGQILGYWILAKRNERNVVFPVRMRGFRFFGPPPPPGADVECRVRVTAVTGTALTADVQLLRAGAVWAEIAGWQDRRFSVVSACRPGGYPENRTLSAARPGGWCLLADAWPDIASRDLVMRTHLGAAERETYEAHPPRGRRQWLLGRIAAKDAVRHWLWRRGEGPVFPAEVEIRAAATGRPYAVGRHGRELPPLDVSIAHRAEVAVALVRPVIERPHPDIGVGIDVEVVAARAETTRAVALGAHERWLLADRCAAGGEPESVWFTRFWAAKEAVAKAEGTGLRGRPRDFAVVAAEPYELVVETPRHRHRVRCAHAATSMPGAPARDYVVAWTTTAAPATATAPSAATPQSAHEMSTETSGKECDL